MKTKPVEGKSDLEAFTRTMKALFRVPKSEVQEPAKAKPSIKKPRKVTA